MVYYKDFFTIFIFLIFQFGVVFNNLENYQKKNYKFTLIYFSLSLFFYLFYLIITYIKDRNSKEKEENILLETEYKKRLFDTHEY